MSAVEYTEALAIDICARLAGGMPLTAVCKLEGMPSLRTAYRWVADHPEFALLYANARIDMAHTLFAECIEIADEAPLIIEHEGEKVTVRFDQAAVARNKVRVSARQHAASKLLPREYGEKLQLAGADDLAPIRVEHQFERPSPKDVNHGQRVAAFCFSTAELHLIAGREAFIGLSEPDREELAQTWKRVLSAKQQELLLGMLELMFKDYERQPAKLGAPKGAHESTSSAQS